MEDVIDTDKMKPPASPAGLVLAAVWLAFGAALALLPDGPGLIAFLFVLSGWVLAVAVHEFGHAYVAWLGGDHTVVDKGYLTFDPRRYTDLGVSLVIPLLALAMGGIGFPGGAVWLREDLMRGRAWRSAASLAGPAGTLLALVLLALAARAAGGLGHARLADALGFLAFLQATAVVLNLLPLPGLDGFNALRPFLPEALRAAARVLEPFGMLALLALLLMVPAASAVLFGTGFALAAAAGVDPQAVSAGFDDFQFWR